MSARDPYIPSPASPRIIAWSHPEDVIAACLQQGLSAKLHEPDLGKSPRFEVTCTGDQMRALGKWNDRYYHGGAKAYEAARARYRRSVELSGLAAEAYREYGYGSPKHLEAGRAIEEYEGRPSFSTTYTPAPRPRGGWGSDTVKQPGSADYKFRCYQLSELVFDTALAHGLRAERVTFPDEDFVMAWIWAEEKDFRRAQYDWLTQMISAMPKHKPTPMELDIFA